MSTTNVLVSEFDKSCFLPSNFSKISVKPPDPLINYISDGKDLVVGHGREYLEYETRLYNQLERRTDEWQIEKGYEEDKCGCVQEKFQPTRTVDSDGYYTVRLLNANIPKTSCTPINGVFRFAGFIYTGLADEITDYPHPVQYGNSGSFGNNTLYDHLSISPISGYRHLELKGKMITFYESNLQLVQSTDPSDLFTSGMVHFVNGMSNQDSGFISSSVDIKKETPKENRRLNCRPTSLWSMNDIVEWLCAEDSDNYREASTTYGKMKMTFVRREEWIYVLAKSTPFGWSDRYPIHCGPINNNEAIMLISRRNQERAVYNKLHGIPQEVIHTQNNGIEVVYNFPETDLYTGYLQYSKFTDVQYKGLNEDKFIYVPTMDGIRISMIIDGEEYYVWGKFTFKDLPPTNDELGFHVAMNVNGLSGHGQHLMDVGGVDGTLREVEGVLVPSENQLSIVKPTYVTVSNSGYQFLINTEDPMTISGTHRFTLGELPRLVKSLSCKIGFRWPESYQVSVRGLIYEGYLARFVIDFHTDNTKLAKEQLYQ